MKLGFLESFKYAILFLLMSVAAVTAAEVRSEPLLRTGLLLAAISFLFVAVAYLRGWPWLLMKRPNGRRPWWAWVLLWPYFGLAWMSFWLVRQLHRRGASTEVAPGLWLSRRLGEREVRSSGIPWVAVLDLAAELPRGAPPELAYLSLAVLDGTPPSVEQLNRAIRWINEQRARGPVLVHCAAGHGRSATVVLAWMVSSGEAEDVESGLANLRRLRPGVALKPRQLARVREFRL